MNIEQPWLIIEFPFWLDDIEIEIFWYDGNVSGNFFEQVRAVVVELYLDPDFVAEINESVELWLIIQQANPHQQYLLELEAQSTYSTPKDLADAIASHLNAENPHNITS